MILVQMYNIFRLLTGVPDYSIVVSRMEVNKNMLKMMGISINSYKLYTIYSVVHLTLTDPLRIQPWSQDRRNRTKLNLKNVRR